MPVATMGMKVIIDWVANHTGYGHEWMEGRKRDYYDLSPSGNFQERNGWEDVADLDYGNNDMRREMIESMQFWVKTCDIDGFRCDMAHLVPLDFWLEARRQCDAVKPLFWLAETEDETYHAAFDATYAWEWMHTTEKFFTSTQTNTVLDAVLSKYEDRYPKPSFKMFFTSNHDENSWNQADYNTMPGAVHAPFAVLTQTWGRSVPLIYSGQEEPFLDSIRFFYKDTITFGKYERAAFYQKLLNLRKSNPALAANASLRKVDAGTPAQVYAYVREKDGKKVLVVLNLSAKAATVKLTDASVNAEALNLFSGSKENPAAKDWGIEPWGYAVYVY